MTAPPVICTWIESAFFRLQNRGYANKRTVQTEVQYVQISSHSAIAGILNV
jgi:hypothetical protein